MTLPCMRDNNPSFEHETTIEVENHLGEVEHEYLCRITYEIGEGDEVIICLVEVAGGTASRRTWQDADHVTDYGTEIYEAAERMVPMLLDNVLCEVEDRRIENADAEGHAHREKRDEGDMGW